MSARQEFTNLMKPVFGGIKTGSVPHLSQMVGHFAERLPVKRFTGRLRGRSSVAVGAVLALMYTAVAGWEARLEDGTLIRVDPRTDRATAITEKGAQVPLWDGVHRLQDGSAIITHSGIVVPTKQILKEAEAPAGPQPSQREAGVSPCLILERKVCGAQDECKEAKACRLGRQLLEFEQTAGPDQVPTQSDPSRQKCFDALQDEVLFKPCETAQLPPSVPCQELLQKACGAEKQCAEDNACSLAHQLVRMEREERLSNLDPGSTVHATEQCRDGLRNQEVFHPCRK